MKGYCVLLWAAGIAATASLSLLIWSGQGDNPAGPGAAPRVQSAPAGRVEPPAAVTSRAEGPWILFLSHRSGKNLLYRMRPDGSELKSIFGGALEEMPGLPDGSIWYREPHWSRQSPDGRFFLSYAIDHGLPVRRFRTPPRFLLHLGRMEGGATRLITPDAIEVFAWAPDSRRFAYARSLWGHPATFSHPVAPRTELVVAPIDGSGEDVVLDRPGVWVPVDWSPDGTRLIVSYMSTPILQKASSARFELDLAAARAAIGRGGSRPDEPGEDNGAVAPQGAGLRVIVPFSRELGGSAARYSPDGKEIAFMGSTLRPEPEALIDPARYAASFELRVIDRGSGAARVIFRGPDIFGGPICWSPDGGQILFARYDRPDQAVTPDREPPGDIMTIWSIGRDGRGLRAITPGWSPDWRSGSSTAPSAASPARPLASSGREQSAASHAGGAPAEIEPEQAVTRLKQLGIGLAVFQKARAARPTPEVRSRLPVDQQASWVVGMLPSLGRSDLTEAIHTAATDGEDRPWNDPANRQAIGSVIVGLVTPDLASSGTLRDASGAGLTGYVGVAGTGPNSPTLPEDSKDPARGYFGYHRIARPAEVTDGLSSTAMLMEVKSNRGPWAQNGPSTVRPIESFEGGLVLMADGSVRSLGASTDPGLLRAMSTIAAKD